MQGIVLKYTLHVPFFHSYTRYRSMLLGQIYLYMKECTITSRVYLRHLHRYVLFSGSTLAKEGEVKELWLTHFSPSLSVPEEYLQNARDIFENRVIGEDRLIKNLNFME